jgi:ferredoxin-thioredoxin reductase catalytic subunit
MAEYEIEEELDETEECLFTADDLKELAKNHIRLFFKDKAVEDKKLYTDRNICLVLNLDICEGIPAIYEALKPSHKKDVPKKKRLTEDVSFVLGLLRECSQLGIPKCSAAGLIAVYMETCKGYKLDI